VASRLAIREQHLVDDPTVHAGPCEQGVVDALDEFAVRVAAEDDVDVDGRGEALVRPSQVREADHVVDVAFAQAGDGLASCRDRVRERDVLRVGIEGGRLGRGTAEDADTRAVGL
jgi:hypothetical protein